MPSGTDDDTRRRMKRKLGNIDRTDDDISRRLAKRMRLLFPYRWQGSRHSVLQAATAKKKLPVQSRMLFLALGHRLDPDFFERSACHLKLYVGTVKSARACVDEVARDAGQAFLRRERTLGIPGLLIDVVSLVGPSSTFIGRADFLQLGYRAPVVEF